jgi:hypothetical protein
MQLRVLKRRGLLPPPIGRADETPEWRLRMCAAMGAGADTITVCGLGSSIV